MNFVPPFVYYHYSPVIIMNHPDTLPIKIDRFVYTHAFILTCIHTCKHKYIHKNIPNPFTNTSNLESLPKVRSWHGAAVV